MVFMTEHFGARISQRTSDPKPRAAIAQMQFALRERRFQSEQPGHLMPFAVGILEPAPQHHIATAFAVDGNGAVGQFAKTARKWCADANRAGMEFRIAAGQPDGVGAPHREPHRPMAKTE